ncbi:MAG: MerR family transcriptional regulator [Polyangiaceae bacterium]
MRDPRPRHLPLADLTAAADACGDGCGCQKAGDDVADGERALAEALMPPAVVASPADDKLLQVGDIAKLSGKTVRAIHHYEELGLLQPHARSKGRYRLYDAGAVARVRWINKMHDLGLSLPQIQEIVRTWESASSAPSAMAAIRDVYHRKLEETRAQIEHLRSLERELRASIRYLDTCDACDPAEIVQACSSCHVHERDQAQPEMVAGIHGNAPRHMKSVNAAD